MGKVYQSVRGVVHGTLHRRKPDIMVSARAKGDDGSLNDAIQELEKIFVEGIGRLKAVVGDDQAMVASKAQHAEQVIEGLEANITVLEAKLRETEDTGHRKDVASQKMEESLSTEIRDLKSVVKKKEEALESRDSEVNDLKSKIDVLIEQVTHLELAIQQAKGEAASEVIEGLKVKIATLEAQLTQTEQIVGGMDSTIKGLDQDRDRQVMDLNAELEPQTNGIKEMSSFFSKAEALVDIQAQDNGTVVAGEQSKPGEEKPATSQAPGVTSIVTEAARETVSQDAFDRMIAEFSELTNVIGSIASLIVRDHVKALGESMEEFPQTRLTELLESLSGGISDDKLKADFRKRFGKV
jgi:hypothetical protein